MLALLGLAEEEPVVVVDLLKRLVDQTDDESERRGWRSRLRLQLMGLGRQEEAVDVSLAIARAAPMDYLAPSKPYPILKGPVVTKRRLAF